MIKYTTKTIRQKNTVQNIKRAKTIRYHLCIFTTRIIKDFVIL